MKHFQAVLINRLAHQVKNDLTTMRLALFNLDYYLNAQKADDPISEKSNDFLQAIKTSLDQGIKTLSRILLVTRSDKKYFKSENIIRILCDVITQSPAHEKFEIKTSQKNIQILTDAQSLQLFFELLLDNLAGALNHSNSPITVQWSDKDDHCIVFNGDLQRAKISEMWQFNNASSFEGTNSITFLLLRQMIEYLDIALELKQNEEGQSEVKVYFNQEDGEE